MVLHEKTKQAFSKVGLKMTDAQGFVDHANTRNYEKFMAVVNEEGLKVTEVIQACYRVQSGGKEYMFFHKELHATTRIGSDIEFYYPHFGRIQMPKFKHNVVHNSAKPGTFRKEAEVNGEYFDYEIEWTKENLKKFAKLYDEKTKFYIIDSDNRFGITRHDFENGDRAALVASQRGMLAEEMRKFNAQLVEASRRPA